MRKLLIFIIIIIVFQISFSDPIFSNDSFFTRDKIDHFFTPLVITISSYLIIDNLFEDIDNNNKIIISVSVPILFSIGKEIYDGVSKTGEVSYKDLIYDFLGILTGILIVR